MRAVAIIPARGGSKRIPKKNIRPFLGKPIIAYSLIAAKEARVFDRIIVSTDSEEIARLAIEHGGEVPFLRPKNLSGDHTHTEPVLAHALNWLSYHDTFPDLFCCIYATAPFIRAEDIRKGLTLMKNGAVDTAFSVTTFPYTPFKAMQIDENGRLKIIWPEYLENRSQDLPQAYHDAGQFYWAKTAVFLKTESILSSNALPIVLPRFHVADIDTFEDWELAERMYKAIHTGTAPGNCKKH